MEPTRDQLERLARQVAQTRHDELHCDQIVDLVCGYFEAIKRDERLTAGQQEVRKHLELCPECVEVYRGLCDSCDGDDS